MDWVTKDSLPKLAARLNSPAPALGVVSVIFSGDGFRTPSTEGEQALYLILGYRYKRYPPSLTSSNLKRYFNLDDIAKFLDKEHIPHPPVSTWTCTEQFAPDK